MTLKQAAMRAIKSGYNYYHDALVLSDGILIYDKKTVKVAGINKSVDVWYKFYTPVNLREYYANRTAEGKPLSSVEIPVIYLLAGTPTSILIENEGGSSPSAREVGIEVDHCVIYYDHGEYNIPLSVYDIKYKGDSVIGLHHRSNRDVLPLSRIRGMGDSVIIIDLNTPPASA